MQSASLCLYNIFVNILSRLSINFFLSYEFQLVTLQSDVDVSKMLVIMLQQVVEIGMVRLITIIAMWPMMTRAW